MDIAIIGGGSAGIIAAINAVQNKAQVEIIERMPRVGKKLLATGNGRCNITNFNLDISKYYGKNPNFVHKIVKQFDHQKTLEFFSRLGLAWKVEEDGKVFPSCDQASSVLDLLRYEIKRQKVIECCNAEVIRIEKAKDRFKIILKNDESFFAKKIILATGGKSSPKLGSNGSGYELASMLGHSIIEPFPALVQIRLAEPFLKSIQGIKINGKAALVSIKNELGAESGEILFTNYGISGLPILELSRNVNEISKKELCISLDLFPNNSTDELINLLSSRFAILSYKTTAESFIGLLNKRLIPVILNCAHIDQKKLCLSISQGDIKNIANILKSWTLKVSGTMSWQESQVTAGGVNVDEIDNMTLESKIVPGIYFAGEVMDIDGKSGGYNLQWAWSSGYIASNYASLSIGKQ